MSCSTKRIAWLAFVGLAALGALASPAHAQRGFRQPMIRGPVVIPYPVNPNGFLGAFPTAQQTRFNARTIGASIRAIPPYAYGYNPYPSPIINNGPIVPSYPAYPSYPSYPYASLSTSPYATAPYGGGGTLSTGGGYSLSTTGSGYADPYYGGGYGGYGPGSGLQGIASVNNSLGNYQIQVQQAKLIQEQAKQANIETAKKRLQLEAYYESMKMTAPQLRLRDQQNELDRARNDPPAVEVWSGKSLNELLRSIEDVGPNNLKTGPQIDLSDLSLENVNLTDGSQGNVGLLKPTDKDGKLSLTWPAVFSREPYATPANALTNSLSEAVAALKKKQTPDLTMRDVEKNYNALSNELAKTGTTDELSPAQYIEAKRYLRQLDQAIKALTDPKKAAKYFDDWKPKGKTVAELVSHMMTNGLKFAPAASGDEAAYSALYQALRAYEGGLHQTSSSNK